MERFLDAWGRIVSDPLVLGMLAFFGASLAGLASELRSGRTLSRRSIIAAILHSGFWGLIIFLVGYSQLAQNLPVLVAMSLLSGIGGATVTDLILALFKRGLGIRISIEK